MKKKRKKHPLSLQRSVNKFLKKSGVLKREEQIRLGSLVTVYFGSLHVWKTYPWDKKDTGYVVGFKQGSNGPAIVVEPEKDKETWLTNQGMVFENECGFIIEWERIVSVSNNADVLTMLTHSSLEVRKIAKKLVDLKKNDE